MILARPELELMYNTNLKEIDLYPSWYNAEKYYNCEHFKELFVKNKKKKKNK